MEVSFKSAGYSDSASFFIEVLENPLFRETAVRKQKFVRKIFMIISVVCDLKRMPDAKNYIPGLDWWALSWFLGGHILTVLSQLLNVS